MALIPKQDELHEVIEGGLVTQEPREYIGISGLAGPCSRRIWYDFHWAYDRQVTKRIQRIFERGDIEEPRVIKDLEDAGVKCTYVLNNQVEVVDKTGHIKGHPDGKADNVPTAPKTTHLLEIKTMKASIFKNYVNKGLEKSHPTYWGQVHTYMGEMKLTRCLFSVTNKDTEERHYERIHYDKTVHDEVMTRGFDILTSEFPPKKIGEVTWYECKMCDAKQICHRGAKINRNCRTCKHFDIEMEGKFACGLYGQWLNREDQMLGCGDYEISEVY